MPIRNTIRPGDFLANCMICGFTFYGSQLRQQWDGLRTCSKCFSPRHPQDYVRGVRDDQTVPFANPPGTPHFLEPNEVTREDL